MEKKIVHSPPTTELEGTGNDLFQRISHHRNMMIDLKVFYWFILQSIEFSLQTMRKKILQNSHVS